MSKILGVGAALVDLLSEVNESWVESQGFGKGGMNLVDWPRMETMLATLNKVETVPGGSACNTIRGVARLGDDAAFLSKVGSDELGRLFLESLSSSKVESRLVESSTPTGRVLSAVTPDAQRSMYTFLGASAETAPQDLTANVFDGIGMVYMEGYLAYNAPWFSAVIAAARKAKIPLAFDFGSFNVVEHNRALLDETFAIAPFEVLIANEDEAKAFTGLEGEAALRKMMPYAKIAVVKLGKDGALIAQDGTIVRIPAYVVTAVDTTGAGDLWAAGFLYGLRKGWTNEKSGLLASRVASEVVQVLGPMIPDAGWTRILSSADFSAG
jgi:sugar/nucleoside kinase (ribokinase family)